MDSWKVEHKKQQIGASYDTNYQVIETCIPDCPACACKHLAEKVLEAWQDWEHWNPDKDKDFSAKYHWPRSAARTFGDWLEIELNAEGILKGE